MNEGRRETQGFIAHASQAAAAAALDSARRGRDAPGIELDVRRSDGARGGLLVSVRAHPRCGDATPGLVCVGLPSAEHWHSPTPHRPPPMMGPMMAPIFSIELRDPADAEGGPRSDPQLELEAAAAGLRALRELRALIGAANAPIVGVDARGRVYEWNARMAAVTGFSREEALGENLVLVCSASPSTLHTHCASLDRRAFRVPAGALLLVGRLLRVIGGCAVFVATRAVPL